MPTFLQPATLDEALALLPAGPRLLAGGTDVIVLLRAGAINCEQLMDVKRIPQLSVFSYTEEGLEIGGAVTCNQILEADFLAPGHMLLKQAAAELANVLLRNRATLIGNICNASPGGDMIPACLVLEGKLTTASPGGGRVIPLSEFFTGVKKHVLRPDEMVVKITLPRKDGRGLFLKKKRIRGHDLAQVSAAGFYGGDGSLLLAFGAVGPTPVLCSPGVFKPEELAAKKAEIIESCAAACRPIGDVRSSLKYRQAMIRHFTGEILDTFAKGGTP